MSKFVPNLMAEEEQKLASSPERDVEEKDPNSPTLTGRVSPDLSKISYELIVNGNKDFKKINKFIKDKNNQQQSMDDTVYGSQFFNHKNSNPDSQDQVLLTKSPNQKSILLDGDDYNVEDDKEELQNDFNAEDVFKPELLDHDFTTSKMSRRAIIEKTDLLNNRPFNLLKPMYKERQGDSIIA